MCNKLLLIVLGSMFLVVSEGTLYADYSYEEIVQGLQMRDSLMNTITLDFTKTSSFPDGRKNILHKKNHCVYKGDNVFLREERNGEFGVLLDETSFNGKQCKYIQHYNRIANIQYYPDWVDSLRELFQFGLDDVEVPTIGKWFSKRQGVLDGTKVINGYQAYGISDGGRDSARESYTVWIIPELGFTPVRIEKYMNGFAKKLIQINKLNHNKENGTLYDPESVTVWNLNLNDKLAIFDPNNPVGNWIRIDFQIDQITYNRSYPDSFFNIEIPQGYTVMDQLVGLNYVMGQIDDDIALEHLIADVKTAFSDEFVSSEQTSNLNARKIPENQIVDTEKKEKNITNQQNMVQEKNGNDVKIFSGSNVVKLFLLLGVIVFGIPLILFFVNLRRKKKL